MTHEILVELPRRITIGDTITWDEALSDFPASASWVVTYNFTSPTAQFSSTHAIINVDDHRITIVTTSLEEGHYEYTKKVTDGTTTHTLERGVLDVGPDLSADTAGVDRRSFAEVALESIEAMLLGKATKDQTSYSLNGRALSRYSFDELRAFRAELRIEVADDKQKQRRAAGGKSHRNVHAEFSSAVP
jgi:hypothetical protein